MPTDPATGFFEPTEQEEREAENEPWTPFMEEVYQAWLKDLEDEAQQYTTEVIALAEKHAADQATPPLVPVAPVKMAVGQPRDYHGRWTSGGGGRSLESHTPPPTTAEGSLHRREADRLLGAYNAAKKRHDALPDGPAKDAAHKEMRDASKAFRVAKASEHAAEGRDPITAKPTTVVKPPSAAAEAIRALNELDATSSVEQVEQRLTMALHQIVKPVQGVPGRSIDFDDLAPQHLVPEARMLARLAQHYPGAMSRLIEIKGVDTKNGTVAPQGHKVSVNGWVDPGMLSLSTGNTSGVTRMTLAAGFGRTDVPSIRSMSRRGALDGWHPPESSHPGSTSVHEFGHVLDHHLGQLEREGQRGRPLHPGEDILQGNFMSSDAVSGWAPKYNAAVVKHGSGISRYAQRNRNEAFAEAFTAYYLGSTHPAATAAGQWVRDRMGTAPRYNDPS